MPDHQHGGPKTLLAYMARKLTLYQLRMVLSK